MSKTAQRHEGFYYTYFKEFESGDGTYMKNVLIRLRKEDPTPNGYKFLLELLRSDIDPLYLRTLDGTESLTREECIEMVERRLKLNQIEERDLDEITNN